MRVAIGALMQESNAFCLSRASLQDFANKYLERGGAVIERLTGTRTEMGGAIGVLQQAGAEIVPLIATHGGAGGIVGATCHQALRRDLLNRLRAAGRVDAVFLALHGAMTAEDEDDVEGALLADVRGIVGKVPLAVSCDLHAHVTPRMIALCDILVGYQHYPHDDAPETAARAVTLMLDQLAGRLVPAMVMHKVPALFAPHLENTFGTGPMVDMDRMAREIEADDGPVKVVSYFPVQPWLDVPDMGFAAVAVADADMAAAEAAARQIATTAWRRRHEFDVAAEEMDRAIQAALAVPGAPVLLADTSDCVGGGSTGDGAAVLEALLRLGIEEPAFLHIVDPVVAAKATAAGEGAQLRTALGNRIDTRRGGPVPITAVVARLLDGRFTYDGGFLGGVTAQMGPSAVLTAGALRILVTTYAAYEWADEPYRAAGLDVRTAKLVSVKNPMNYKLTYPFAAAAFVLDTAGPTTPNLRSLAWHRLKRPFFPKDDLAVLA